MIATSSISVVARDLRTFLADQIDAVEEERILIGHPKDAIESVKTKHNDEHHLNLFFYQVIHDGYPADNLAENPVYLRLHCLITPVCTKDNNQTRNDTSDDSLPGENDLRLIGSVIEQMHKSPVLMLKNGGEDFALLQVVPLNLSLDDLNHIWSTQGEVAYRLSAAYELALVPLPMERPKESGPLVAAIGSEAKPGITKKALPEEGLGIKGIGPVVSGFSVDTGMKEWAPHICFFHDGGLQYTLLFEEGSVPANVSLLIAGDKTEDVTLIWQHWDKNAGWVKDSDSDTLKPQAEEIPSGYSGTPAPHNVPPSITSKGQAVLYVERSIARAKHAGSSETFEMKLRSNPLIITIIEAAP